ncbi:MAG: c-type cytochrome [Bryobacteraceae bacterium]
MRWGRGSRLLFALLLAAAGASGQGTDRNPFSGSQEAVAAGRKLYMTSCAGCHGPGGEGGRGPRLSQNGRIRGAQDGRLFDSIKNGVRGSDMPPSPLGTDQVWQLVSFVRSVNAPAYESPAVGDAAAGEKLYGGKGRCSGCHAIGGKGGVLGPDLSHIGMTRSVAQLREALLKPSERPTEGYGGVTVIRRGGEKIQGVVKNNTNYAIQVLDRAGNLHLLDKADLEEIVFRRGSLMPGDYGTRLTRQEQNDVIAFLSRQAVRIPEKEDEQEARGRRR